MLELHAWMRLTISNMENREMMKKKKKIDGHQHFGNRQENLQKRVGYSGIKGKPEAMLRAFKL